MEKITCSVREWSEIVGCSLPRAYDMTHIEGFPVVCVGKKRLILLSQAKLWLAEQSGRVLARA